MTLREELPPKNQPLTFCAINQSAHDEISNQIAEFLKKGGKVDVIAPGACKDTIEFNKTIESKKQADAREQFQNTPKPKPISLAVKKEISEAENKARKKAKKMNVPNPENRAKSGYMNIHTLPNGKHVLTIKSMHFGTFIDLREAIAKRDVEREFLGLPKAEY